MIITQGLLVVNYTNVPIKWVAKGLEYILSLHLFISLKFLLHTCYKISSNDSKEQAPYNYSRSPFFPSRYELAGIYIQSLPPPKGGDLLSWQPLEELSNWLTREDKAVFCLQQGKVWYKSTASGAVPQYIYTLESIHILINIIFHIQVVFSKCNLRCFKISIKIMQ